MNSIKKYFTIWWIPIIAYLIPIITYLIGDAMKKDDIIDFALLLLYLNIVGNLISSIVQIVSKKWYFIIPQILVSVSLFFFVSILFTFSPPDYYGASKVIPKNIKFEIPIEREVSENDLHTNDFKLASISQPGIYNYYTNYKPTQKGIFFIKAYEVTSNERLSEDRMTERSKIVVEDLNNKIYSGELTIYEGSWGDKYGARIELWYRPENGTEYKLIHKNYIVEGWMR